MTSISDDRLPCETAADKKIYSLHEQYGSEPNIHDYNAMIIEIL